MGYREYTAERDDSTQLPVAELKAFLRTADDLRQEAQRRFDAVRFHGVDEINPSVAAVMSETEAALGGLARLAQELSTTVHAVLKSIQHADRVNDQLEERVALVLSGKPASPELAAKLRGV